MHGESKEAKGQVHKMENKVSVRQEPAYIVLKRAAVTNITNYKYCFNNNLQRKQIDS